MLQIPMGKYLFVILIDFLSLEKTFSMSLFRRVSVVLVRFHFLPNVFSFIPPSSMFCWWPCLGVRGRLMFASVSLIDV